MTDRKKLNRRLFAGLLALSSLLAPPMTARADQNYSQQVFFENSLSPNDYYYSSGRASAPSTLRLSDGKLPVETTTFISGPNALKLQWVSSPEGGWSAELHLYEWRDRTVDFPGAKLWLWLYAADGIRATDLPRLALRDTGGNFTSPLEIGAFTSDLPPGKWMRVGIPLSAFRTASLHPFEPHRVNRLVFVQGAADGAQHTLDIDDIRIEDDPPADQATPPTPQGVAAKGYERHIDITWQAASDPALAQYVIYRSEDGQPFQPIGVQRPGVNRYCEFPV